VKMISSSNKSSTDRALDSMLVVYSLLEGHPASSACSQFISERTGWFTSVLVILETRAILTKVYGVSAELVSRKLAELVSGPILVEELDSETATTAFDLADSMGLDLTDAVLLHSAQRNGAQWIATEDQKLRQSCGHVGLNC
jgi:predicted nucleic acid-binding protein